MPSLPKLYHFLSFQLHQQTQRSLLVGPYYLVMVEPFKYYYAVMLTASERLEFKSMRRTRPRFQKNHDFGIFFIMPHF